MAKATSTLDWAVVRLGDDHNWWVAETSDPVRWDVDGLSIVDPRQLQHLIELVDALRDYGFDQDAFESAFIPFRIDKDLGSGYRFSVIVEGAKLQEGPAKRDSR